MRIENTLLIKKYVETEFGQFLQMEPLTLCPIDTLPIVKSMLSDEEKDWLNMYHKMVCDKLLPYLDDSEKRWLIDATRGIQGYFE